MEDAFADVGRATELGTNMSGVSEVPATMWEASTGNFTYIISILITVLIS